MKTTLKKLAQEIESTFPDLVAVVYPESHPRGGYCNTDRKIGRLRHPGKGRRGSRLVVSLRGRLPSCTYEPTGEHDFTSLGPHCRECGVHREGVVFEHNAAQTYRTNQDVVDWIRRRKEGRA